LHQLILEYRKMRDTFRPPPCGRHSIAGIVFLARRKRICDGPVKALCKLALMAILALSTPVSGRSQAVNCPGVLSEQQLTTLLTGKVLEPRVLQFIKQCGIGFQVTAAAESGLRKAGATTAVVNAARARAPREPSHAAEEKKGSDRQQEWTRLKFEFVKVAPGEFTMGCSAGDNECDENEKPAHHVRITKEFEIGKYEVTQAMWESVMGSNPSHNRGSGSSGHPVERVTSDDIRQFLQRLNATKDGYRYRLPTEAEWEYAARAGSAGPYSGPLDLVAWYEGNSGMQSHAVGLKQPNAWGLYDVHGNVWERVQDGGRKYTRSPQSDPAGPTSGDLGQPGVVRGGSWYQTPRLTRASARPAGVTINGRSVGVGFRCVREAIP
jgi:formylglycine-generating enzyme required for sulfatase activity